MNLYDLKMTRNFLRETAMLAVGAAREFPKKSKAKIADALVDTLEELPIIVDADGSARLGSKAEAERVRKAGGNSRRVLSSLALAAGCLFAECRSDAAPAPVDYGRLLYAVAMVESDGGKTSRNVFQITRSYWEDVNRFRRWNWHSSSYADMVCVVSVASEYVLAYWDYYGDLYQRRTKQPITAEVLAKMHRVGFEGLWTRKATADAYWKRVRRVYLNLTKPYKGEGEQVVGHPVRGKTLTINQQKINRR